MTWKTIDTAPKDGTIILAYYPLFWKPGGDFTDSERRWAMTTVRWDYDEYDNDVGYWYLLDGTTNGEPTHWMPLPDVP